VRRFTIQDRIVSNLKSARIRIRKGIEKSSEFQNRRDADIFKEAQHVKSTHSFFHSIYSQHIMKTFAFLAAALAVCALVASAASSCPGCPVTVDTGRSDVLAAAQFAASSVAANALVSDVVVTSAKVQVVNGVNFYLRLPTAESFT
jgi:hypothetical protein